MTAWTSLLNRRYIWRMWTVVFLRMTLWLPRQDIRFSVTELMHTSVSEPRCGRMSWATLSHSVIKMVEHFYVPTPSTK